MVAAAYIDHFVASGNINSPQVAAVDLNYTSGNK